MTNKAFELQKELKVNAEEYQGYLKELYRWEDEIKVKDENLKQSTCKQEPVSCHDLVLLNRKRRTDLLHRGTLFEGKRAAVWSQVTQLHQHKP